MLDADTKRRIDTARDILVGEVPDPKSQVEQITIAMIYKFMDDIDAEAEELGGEREFFAGDFARYGWAKLVQPGIGGYEMLNLYAEAIERMPENPGIPPLFRSIFNNAYLPYRDPETLRSFLKIIDEFTYDHSERLGDAFEYLLSVLGSQGDAGQFRTPRHIIDFIVEVVDPKKDELILDPACGTAGFLISSYKHIRAANTDTDGNSTLTPDDMGRLAGNFKGYDISPDMVRLSLVNMYLHGFVSPSIFEYDTLTSEERWDEYADVILANPPFMNPKGGIRPHNRFSIKGRRSEVLFVDYMAEHLTPSGRAGIIVPDGVVSRMQNAYRQLRRMLVEDCLVAVVSLPAGVFKPYSGVKTSILILDKLLARKTEQIGFFNVENDGYDLGDQRRPITENDLPQVHSELVEYLSHVRTNKPLNSFHPDLGLVVSKARIAADGEYVLNGRGYQEREEQTFVHPLVSIGSVVKAVTPPHKIQKTNFQESGRFPIMDQSQNPIAGWTDDESALVHSAKPLVIFGDHTCSVKLSNHPFAQGADGIKILQTDDSLDPHYLFYTLRSRPLESEGYRRHFAKLKELEIPLPPLEVQEEIAAEINGYQRVIDGARAVVDNYRPHITVDPEWPLVAISEIATPQYGFTASAKDHGEARFIRITDISEKGTLSHTEPKFIDLTNKAEESLLAKGDILVARTGATYGKTMLFDEDCSAVFASYLIRLRFPSHLVDPHFYWAFAQTEDYWAQAKLLKTGGGQPQFNGNAIKRVKVPLPPLETQQAIVAEIEAERALVDANRELITRFEKKIKDTINRVWT